MQRMHTVRKDSDTQSLISIIRLFPMSPTRRTLVQRFITQCYVYADAYRSDEVEHPPPGSAERRTAAHNTVMATVQKLFLQSGAEQMFGGAMPDRNRIREYILTHEARYRNKPQNKVTP